MYTLRVVIFSLDEPNLTRIFTVFKENLVKYKGKRTSRECTFILFLILMFFCITSYQIFSQCTADTPNVEIAIESVEILLGCDGNPTLDGTMKPIIREDEKNNLPQMKKLFFLYVWLNLP